MKQVLNFYKGVGRQAQKFDTVKKNKFMTVSHPFIDMTPGRLQYYKAENEPFIPGRHQQSITCVCREYQMGRAHAREVRNEWVAA